MILGKNFTFCAKSWFKRNNIYKLKRSHAINESLENRLLFSSTKIEKSNLFVLPSNKIKNEQNAFIFIIFLKFHSLEKWVGSCYRVTWSNISIGWIQVVLLFLWIKKKKKKLLDSGPILPGLPIFAIMDCIIKIEDTSRLCNISARVAKCKSKDKFDFSLCIFG